MEFKATWECDIVASDPTDAARTAASIARDQAIRWQATEGVWTIRGEGLPSEGKLVDLEAEPSTPQSRHVAEGGVRCPSCASYRIGSCDQVGHIGMILQAMRCDECGATWTDAYALVEFQDLTPPAEGPEDGGDE